MHRPICVACSVDMRPYKNDVVAVDVANFGDYKAWCADLWRCPKCKHEIITGFGFDAFTVHHEDDFQQKLQIMQEAGKPIYRSYNYVSIEDEYGDAEEEEKSE
jgi:hypothetical protein